MNKNSTSYTFIFAAVMVTVVATLLATAAIALKPAQERNVSRNKMQDILKSVNISVEAKDAESTYAKYITEEVVLNAQGAPIEGARAFDVDLARELKKVDSERQYPLYKANVDGKEYIIIPMRGKGLWGPIWGNIALEDGGSRISNVYGATFDHKGETPGLGAEINTEGFQQQFVGKKIFTEDGMFKPILVKKGGAEASELHAVSGISGGTITSNGVSEMIARTLKFYEKYLNINVTGTEITPEGSKYDDAVETESPDSSAYQLNN